VLTYTVNPTEAKSSVHPITPLIVAFSISLLVFGAFDCKALDLSPLTLLSTTAVLFFPKRSQTGYWRASSSRSLQTWR
jgi:hypothetical protein